MYGIERPRTSWRRSAATASLVALALGVPAVLSATTCADVRHLLNRGLTAFEVSQLTGLNGGEIGSCLVPSGAPSMAGPAGPAPHGAAGPPPSGAAGPAPHGAAGPPPLGAAGPPPLGAAGPPPSSGNTTLGR